MSMERLRAVLARYNLQLVPGAAELTWVGTASYVPLRITCVPEDTTIRVRFELTLPQHRHSLVVMGSRFAIAFNEGLRTGDKTFDATCYMASPATAVLGCFDAETRRITARLVDGGSYISGGALRHAGLIDSFDPPSLLDAQLALIDRLSMDEDLTNHELVRLAQEDPDQGVREQYRHTVSQAPQLRSIEAQDEIGSERHANSEVLERLAQRLHDTSLTAAANLDAANRLIVLFPVVRIARVLSTVAQPLAKPVVTRLLREVEAAAAIGTESLDLALRLIAELAIRNIDLRDAIYPEVVSAFAEGAGRGATPTTQIYDLLARLIGHPSESMLGQIARALSIFRYDIEKSYRLLGPVASRVQRLLPTLARQHPEIRSGLLMVFFERIDVRDVETRSLYVRAIATTADATVCRALAKHLETPFDTLQVEVVQALGAIGTLEVVPMLQPYATGLFRSSDLKEAARTAIASIRDRTNATSLPGALSLSDSAGPGGLALPDEDLDGSHE